jgi:hypothetical protein
MNTEIETRFVTAFVKKEQRERYLTLLASAERRHKILNRFAHSAAQDFEARFLYEEENLPQEIADAIAQTLTVQRKTNPTPSGYVLGGGNRDGQTIPLSEISQIDRDAGISFGAIIILIPDTLAYYRTERSNLNRQPFYILFRPKITG